MSSLQAPATLAPGSSREIVDPAPIIAHCLRRVSEGETWGELAERCGYSYRERSGARKREGNVLKRRLGLAPGGGNDAGSYSRLTYAVAVRICRGLDLDPFEVGL